MFQKYWLERAETLGAKYLMVICDTFDYSDYPVFIMTDAELLEKQKYYSSASMQDIMEIIPLAGKKTKKSVRKSKFTMQLRKNSKRPKRLKF